MYEKTDWKARKGVNLTRYIKLNETSESVILENEPTLVTEPGTPLSPANMNKIEEGIFNAHEGLAAAAERSTALENTITAETANRKQDISGLLYYIADILRLLENDGIIPRTNIVLDDGTYWGTDDGDFVVVA